MDARNLKAIHKRFGDQPLAGYPTIGIFDYYFWYPVVKRIRPLCPLNFAPYSKDQAISYLEDTVGWRSYPRKHGESLFTKFFQNYYLPTKFGYDKRRPHLSGMIAAGSLERSEAVRILEQPLYDADELDRDREYVCRKLKISQEELQAFMDTPSRNYSDFANWSATYSALKRIQTIAQRVTGRSMRIYS